MSKKWTQNSGHLSPTKAVQTARRVAALASKVDFAAALLYQEVIGVTGTAEGRRDQKVLRVEGTLLQRE